VRYIVADSYQEALAGAASMNPNRQPMGTSAISAGVASPQKGKLVPKGNTAAGDPALQAKGQRAPMLAERLGATYGVPVNYTATTDPSAGATQANGRLFKSPINRDRNNFDQGNGTSYN
jgi:hypothetical protein